MNLDMLSDILPESVQDLLGEAPPHPAPPAPGEEPGPPGPVASKPDSAPGNPPGNAMELPPSVATQAAAEIPTPRFAEGQRVMVSPDPTSPDTPMSLSGNAAGTKPGPSVRAGTVVTVLDGELYVNTWMYSVKSQDGATGWIPENRLRDKP